MIYMINRIERNLRSGWGKLGCYNACKIWGFDVEQASSRGCHEVVRMLLEAGHDGEMDNGQPLKTACRCGWAKVVEVLLEYNCWHGWKIALHGTDVKSRVEEVFDTWMESEKYMEYIKYQSEHITASNDLRDR